MTEKKRAMVEEVLAWAKLYRNDSGRRPSQEDIDEFLERWKTKRKGSS